MYWTGNDSFRLIKNKIQLCLITWVEGKEEMADIGPVVECETPCMQFYSQEPSYWATQANTHGPYSPDYLTLYVK